MTTFKELNSPEEEEGTLKSHIKRLNSASTIKKLFAHALMIDMDDNNEKVEVIKEILGPKFSELGPGTNRYGTLGPDGYCHKIAMDRRGIVDNITEFKRAPEMDWVSPKVYETNGVILVAENVELLSKEEFRANRDQILAICEQLSHQYIFTDIGYALKNFCNWGIRKNGDLVVLDTGYLIPILGNEEAMRCPVCGAKLQYNRNYTGFTCSKCSTQFQFIDLYRRLTNKFEEETFADITGFELNLDKLNDNFYNVGIKGGSQKGGLYHGIAAGDELIAGEDGGTIRYEDIADILHSMGQ
jgi:predicted RNA-binding Zn-ribbon protein involved in translation (DUF1610 family)